MTLEEKAIIAGRARQLIKSLLCCDDAKFVDFVLNCIASGDSLSLEPQNLWF